MAQTPQPMPHDVRLLPLLGSERSSGFDLIYRTSARWLRIWLQSIVSTIVSYVFNNRTRDKASTPTKVAILWTRVHLSWSVVMDALRGISVPQAVSMRPCCVGADISATQSEKGGCIRLSEVALLPPLGSVVWNLGRLLKPGSLDRQLCLFRAARIGSGLGL
jgi:hypothetical protein